MKLTQRPIHLRNSLRLAKVGLSLHRESYGAYSSMCSLRDCYFVHAALFPCQAFMDLSPLGLYLYAALFLPFGALNMPKQFLRLLGSMNRKERWERPSPHKILCIPFIYFLLAINPVFLVTSFPTSGTGKAVWILFKLRLAFNFMFVTFLVHVDCFVLFLGHL